jgi:hypothetical protein
MSKQLDFEATEAKAKSMTVAELAYARTDASKAAAALDPLPAAGYYRDEASVYHRELQSR